MEELIAQYKTIIRNHGLTAEIYKWHYLYQFQGRPDLDAPDLAKELLEVKYANLVYQMANASMKELAQNATEPYRNALRKLFDESVKLKDRVQPFIQEVNNIYRSINTDPKKGAHHDERTVSTLLTFKYPNFYTFYKNKYYSKYCEHLGIEQAKSGKRYLHYLELIHAMVNDYILKDQELLDMVDAELDDKSFKDENRILLAQDILYQTLQAYGRAEEANDEIALNPKILARVLGINNRETTLYYFELIRMLYDALEVDQDHESLGFNATGDGTKRFSLNVNSRLLLLLSDDGDVAFFINEDAWKGLKEQLSYTKEEFFANGKDYLLVYLSLAAFKEYFEKIRQPWLDSCTSFLNKEQGSAFHRHHIPEIIELALNPEKLEPYFNATQETLNQLLQEPETAYIKKQNDMQFPLNQILFGPPGTGKTYNTVNKSLEILGNETEGREREELKRDFDAFVQKGQIVFTTFHQSMSYEDFVEGIKPLVSEKEGDPINYAVEPGLFRKISVEASFDMLRSKKDASTTELLDFSIAYDTFIESLEERLLNGEHVELDTKGGGSVLVDSISQKGNIIVKHRDGLRTYTTSKMRLTKLQSAIENLNDVSNINDEFRAIIGGSNSSAYWAVLHAIRNMELPKPKVANERKFNFEEKLEVVQYASSDDYNSASGKPYILIIDEINRGNVSQIFGELITLIEQDKRLGNDESLEIMLPYSKEKFGVPNNLFIIGTMNTADRSVEALDTALRRRFSFVEMEPQPELIAIEGALKETGGMLDEIDLVKLLTTINKRIEKLIDKHHMIGHSYLLKVASLDDLKAAFENSIIPLLQEYFFGDFGKIGLVLGQGFFEEETDDTNVFANFNGYDSSGLEDRVVYRLKHVSSMDNLAFTAACTTLINGK